MPVTVPSPSRRLIKRSNNNRRIRNSQQTIIMRSLQRTIMATNPNSQSRLDRIRSVLKPLKNHVPLSLSNQLNRQERPRRLNWACGLVIGWLGCLTACTQPAIYDQFQSIEGKVWDKDKVYYFTFMVEDNRIPYDLTLAVRNNNMYPYQNLWLFCNEEPPIGNLQRDTVEYMLADDFGKWYGHGISLFLSTFPIRTNYYFPYPGQYTFSFRQGMRNDHLEGIQEIGLTISPSKVSAPSEKRPSAKR